LTGISGGVASVSGGIQWDIVPSDRDVVIQLIDELDDRRLLWEDSIREQSTYCAASASYMRTLIGTIIKTPGLGRELKAELKMMQGHFRQFMTNLASAGLDRPGVVDSNELERVLSWLRIPVGEQIGLLAAQYGVDVSPELATIVPDKSAWFFDSQQRDS